MEVLFKMPIQISINEMIDFFYQIYLIEIFGYLLNFCLVEKL